jgi:hypothetical protein
VQISVDRLGESFEAIELMIGLVDLSGVVVLIPMGENVTEPPDIDDFSRSASISWI